MIKSKTIVSELGIVSGAAWDIGRSTHQKNALTIHACQTNIKCFFTIFLTLVVNFNLYWSVTIPCRSEDRKTNYSRTPLSRTRLRQFSVVSNSFLGLCRFPYCYHYFQCTAYFFRSIRIHPCTHTHTYIHIKLSLTIDTFEMLLACDNGHESAWTPQNTTSETNL